MKDISILVKPCSDRCNMRCSYCFYSDVAGHRAAESCGLMEEDTLNALMEKALRCPTRSCTVAFQGGEPTLAGLPFFERCVELEKKYGSEISVRNAIQTNGYALDEAWADFFAENRFLVGVSLDGVIRVHDAFRRDAQGEGTFQKVTNHIELLRKKKADVNILSVVTSRSAGNVRRIYDFFQKKQYSHLQFIPCVPCLEADGGKLSGGTNFADGCFHDGGKLSVGEKKPAAGEFLTAEEYGRFLTELFDLWFEDVLRGRQPYIRNFENYINILLGMEPYACEQRGRCGNQLVIEADGSVYPCDFYALDPYCLGNIRTDSMETLLCRYRENPPDYALREDPACRTCQYAALCRGGCRRYFDGGSKNRFCLSFRMLFDHGAERMRYLADEIKRNLR